MASHRQREALKQIDPFKRPTLVELTNSMLEQEATAGLVTREGRGIVEPGKKRYPKSPNFDNGWMR